MAQIRYIGDKPSKTDNVAGTDTVWNGKGDVQTVSDPLAVEKLLQHPTVWEIVGEVAVTVTKADKAKAAAAALKAEKKKEEENEEQLPLVNPDRMGRDKLQEFARVHLKIKVDQRHPIAKIRDQVKKAIAQRTRVGPRK